MVAVRSICKFLCVRDKNYKGSQLSVNNDIFYIYGNTGFRKGDERYFNFNIKNHIKDLNNRIVTKIGKIESFDKDAIIICVTHFPVNKSIDNVSLYVNGHTHNNGIINIDNVIHYSCGQTGHPAKDITESYTIHFDGIDYISRQPDGIIISTNIQYIQFLCNHSKDMISLSGKFKKDVIGVKYKGYYIFMTYTADKN